MRPPMRSSIACLRCRRSKIKCDNDGGTTACETCIKTGHKCQYPEATPLPPKRPDPPVTTKTEKESGTERKRAKKLEDISMMDAQRSAAYAEEVLSYPFLTRELWDQIFTIYRLNYVTELPFLHLPTLKEKLSRKLRDQGQSSADLNLVLLGVLTLTARFHSDLVKYVAHMSAPQTGSARHRPLQTRFEPTLASEFFANALTTALGPLRTAMSLASVERVQAFLMLGLYEWSQVKPNSGGLGAWMYVGVAIRMSHALKLGFGDKNPDGSTKDPPKQTKDKDKLEKSSKMKKGGKVSAPSSDAGNVREIKRRTMFSCFILDRMLACGRERVAMIQAEDLQIQLPSTELAFDLGNDVYTGYLSPTPEERARPITDDSVLSRFVQLVHLWGKISKYSFAGGRHLEGANPPWQEGTIFKTLRETLDEFYDSLPETFTLSRQNYYRHDNHQATSSYVSLHMLGALCQIMLHREYLPFIPMRCHEPVGPLDNPIFPPEIVPEGFWAESAEKVFSNARNIIDLIDISREKLPQSSLVCFAIWTAAFVGIYAEHFPHMDTQQHMLQFEESEEDRERISDMEDDAATSGATGLAYQTLTKMAPYMNMAATYVSKFSYYNKYFGKMVPAKDGNSPQDGRLLYAGLPGTGGGLEEWRSHAGKITNNGTILPEDERGPYEGSDRSRASTADPPSSGGQEAYAPGAERVQTPRSTPSMTFRAINNQAMGTTQAPAQAQATPQEHSGPASEYRPENAPGYRVPIPPEHQALANAATQILQAAPQPDPQVMLGLDLYDQFITSHQGARLGEILSDIPEFAGNIFQGYDLGSFMSGPPAFGHFAPGPPVAVYGGGYDG